MATAKQTMGTMWFVRVDGPEEFLRQKSKELCGKIDTKRMFANWLKRLANVMPQKWVSTAAYGLILIWL